MHVIWSKYGMAMNDPPLKYIRSYVAYVWL